MPAAPIDLLQQLGHLQAKQSPGIVSGDPRSVLHRLPSRRRHRRQHVRQQRRLVTPRSHFAAAANAAGREVRGVGLNQQAVSWREDRGGGGGVLAAPPGVPSTEAQRGWPRRHLPGMRGSNASSAVAPRSGRSSHTQPVMPMLIPSPRYSSSSSRVPVKQCTTPGTRRWCALRKVGGARRCRHGKDAAA